MTNESRSTVAGSGAPQAGASERHLSERSLAQLGSHIGVPSYRREVLRPRIVHLGVGAFHRAHQAVYLDDLLQKGIVTDWGEYGMGVLPQDKAMRDALSGQDYLYTVVERSAERQSARVVGSITGFQLAPPDPRAAVERLAGEEVSIVSLTITEGGYFLHEGSGEFDSAHALIQQDAASPELPITSLGFLTAALKLRRDRKIAPFTVLSCDNLQGNGHIARRVVLGLAQMQDEALARWIGEHVAFPNSMVDRITPATTDDDRADLLQRFGVRDAWPVVTEPFRQWVIEDTFCNQRPPWEEVGAQMVTDVLPYELMKIRLLNASHMAIAYLGALAGYVFVHDVVNDPNFAAFVSAFMEEVTLVVPRIPGVQIPEYKRTLQVRFGNPTIKDRVARLCSEGSAKMPKWVLPSVVELAAERRTTRLLTLVIAAWMRYLQSGVNEQGTAIEVVDARADELKRVARASGSDPRPFLSMTSLFGNPLFQSDDFVRAVQDAYGALVSAGARQTIRLYTEAAQKETAS